jgi:hypothetical protein
VFLRESGVLGGESDYRDDEVEVRERAFHQSAGGKEMSEESWVDRWFGTVMLLAVVVFLWDQLFR